MKKLYEKLNLSQQDILENSSMIYPTIAEDLIEKLKKEDNFLNLSIIDLFNLFLIEGKSRSKNLQISDSALMEAIHQRCKILFSNI
jgi:hypothetical protein